MSTTNLSGNAAKVAAMYEAFGRGDVPFIMSHIADDCRWIGSGQGFLPESGVYKGQEAVNFFIKLAEYLNFDAFNPTTIGAVGENEVAAFGNMTTTTKATGKQITYDWAMHWKFNAEGKAVYFQDFFDTALAHQAMQKD